MEARKYRANDALGKFVGVAEESVRFAGGVICKVSHTFVLLAGESAAFVDKLLRFVGSSEGFVGALLRLIDKVALVVGSRAAFVDKPAPLVESCGRFVDKPALLAGRPKAFVDKPRSLVDKASRTRFLVIIEGEV